MKLLNIASILVLSASSLALGTGCMADPGSADDQADMSALDQQDETKAEGESAAADENTGEAKDAWLSWDGHGGCGGFGWGGYGGWGCGGIYRGCGTLAINYPWAGGLIGGWAGWGGCGGLLGCGCL